MDAEWEKTFRNRMRRFETRRPQGIASLPVSIKLRVRSGCFHREHSPRAYKLIDSRLARLSRDLEFVEHESGPELLVFLAIAAGITFNGSAQESEELIARAPPDETRPQLRRPRGITKVCQVELTTK